MEAMKRERDRDVYDDEQRAGFDEAIKIVSDVLNAEQKAEADAEFAEKYPEHFKFDKVREESQAIGLFIETAGWLLCDWPEGRSHPRPTNLSINQVLAKYFDIDLKVLEDEKQAMLEALAKPGG